MDIYNQNKLRELARDFYNLVGLKVCIYDANEDELAFFPEKLSPFCAILREDKEMNQRCLECDRKAFAECKKTHKQHFYTCHAGLLEYMSPVVYGDKIIGYMVLGQIKAEKNRDFEKISHRLPEEKREELQKCYEKLSTISLGKLKSAMRILDACTGYEYLKGLLELSDNKIDLRIADYVSENLAAPLSVSALCSEFHLSHSEVYSISKRYFNSTPAEYIKVRRLSKACELLRKTDMQINKVGVECGFPDYNYFSKVFKREYKISPREYRKKATEK